jgi:hypothetical protein
MTEKLIPGLENREKQERSESLSNSEAQEHKSKSSERRPEEHREEINNLKRRAETEAKSSKETLVDNKAHLKPSNYLVTKELKEEAFQRGLKRIRRHVSKPGKLLSKTIHQPVVDVLSQAGEKTIARPKGLLVGSIAALAGSSYVLYSAKHYGYSYNFGTVLVLFAGGYLAGLVIELLWYGFRRLRGNK